jgi:hypothetical protein
MVGASAQESLTRLAHVGVADDAEAPTEGQGFGVGVGLEPAALEHGNLAAGATQGVRQGDSGCAAANHADVAGDAGTALELAGIDEHAR